MTNRRTRTLAALYGGVAAFALVAGGVGAESGPTICWLGVNCGPINNQPPARGTQHPSTTPAPPPPTPGPQSP